jgi:uncharacterized membrane protein
VNTIAALLAIFETTPDLTPQGNPPYIWIAVAIVLSVIFAGAAYGPVKAALKSRKPRQPRAPRKGTREDPVAILKEKLARGEISEDEFVRKKQLLQS